MLLDLVVSFSKKTQHRKERGNSGARSNRLTDTLDALSRFESII